MKKMKYKVSFKNRFGVIEAHIWEFQLDKSAAAPYGNQTAVTVFHDGNFFYIIDTRYDNDVLHDFAKWCEDYFLNNLNMKLCPRWEVIE